MQVLRLQHGPTVLAILALIAALAAGLLVRSAPGHAGVATHFQVTLAAGEPSSIAAGGSVRIVVTALDAGGIADAGYAGPKSITFSGAASVGGNTPTVTDNLGAPIAFGTPTTLIFNNGVADNTVIGATGQTSMTLYADETADIVATDGGLTTTGTDRLSETVTGGTATRLLIRTSAGGLSAATVTAGGALGLTLSAVDAYDNVDTSYTGDKPLTFAGLSSIGVHTPTVTSTTGTATSLLTATTVRFTNGVADSAVVGTGGTLVPYAAESLELSVSDGPLPGGLIAAGGDVLTVTVNPAAAAKLSVTTQPAGAKTVALATQPAVQVQDQYGNPTSGAATITAALGAGPSGATLGGTLTAATGGGTTATFTGLTIDKSGTGARLDFTSGALTGASSNVFTVTGAAKLAFSTQPGGGTAGSALSTVPVVTVQRDDGSTETGSSATVTLTVASGGTPTLSNASLGATSGVATFTGFTVGSAGTYTLTAASAGLTSATSNSFTITAPASTPAPAPPTCSGTQTLVDNTSCVDNPAIAAVAVRSGSPATGISLAITGAGFAPASTTATYTPAGGTATACATATVVSSTQVICTVPATLAGTNATFSVKVTGLPAATSASVALPAFPAITNVEPPFGQPRTATSVTLSGTGFTSSATVTYGPAGTGSACTAASLGSDGRLACTVGSDVAANARVSFIVTSGGLSSAPSTATFAAVAPPAITDVTGDWGPKKLARHKGTVTITGTGFAPGAAAGVEGAAPVVTWESISSSGTSPKGTCTVARTTATTITCTLANAAGLVGDERLRFTVTVLRAAATARGDAAVLGFRGAPSITSMKPTAGPPGSTVTFTASGITADVPTTVRFTNAPGACAGSTQSVKPGTTSGTVTCTLAASLAPGSKGVFFLESEGLQGEGSGLFSVPRTPTVTADDGPGNGAGRRTVTVNVKAPGATGVSGTAELLDSDGTTVANGAVTDGKASIAYSPPCPGGSFSVRFTPSEGNSDFTAATSKPFEVDGKPVYTIAIVKMPAGPVLLDSRKASSEGYEYAWRPRVHVRYNAAGSACTPTRAPRDGRLWLWVRPDFTLKTPNGNTITKVASWGPSDLGPVTDDANDKLQSDAVIYLPVNRPGSFTVVARYARSTADTPPAGAIQQTASYRVVNWKAAVAVTRDTTTDLKPGSKVAVTAAVTGTTRGDASGTVTFRADADPKATAMDVTGAQKVGLAGARARASFTFDTPGTHTITATFDSDEPGVDTVSDILTVRVVKPLPPISIEKLPDTWLAGRDLKVTVRNGTRGQVALYDGSTLLRTVGEGKTEVPVRLSAGTHSLQLSYPGDSTYAALAEATPTTSRTVEAVAGKSNLEWFKQTGPGTVAVRVKAVNPKAGVPSGKIEIRVPGGRLMGTSVLDDGAAEFAPPGFVPTCSEQSDWEFRYVPDSTDWKPWTTDRTAWLPNRAPVAVTLTVDPHRISVGADPVAEESPITVTVAPSPAATCELTGTWRPTGKVRVVASAGDVTIGDQTVKANSDGTYSVSLSKAVLAKPRKVTLVASYAGDGLVTEGASLPATLVIRRGVQLSLDRPAPVADATAGVAVPLHLTLSAPDTDAAAGKVTFTVTKAEKSGSTAVTPAPPAVSLDTATAGKADAHLSPVFAEPGTYTVTATFAETTAAGEKPRPATATATIIVGKRTPTITVKDVTKAGARSDARAGEAPLALDVTVSGADGAPAPTGRAELYALRGSTAPDGKAFTADEKIGEVAADGKVHGASVWLPGTLKLAVRYAGDDTYGEAEWTAANAFTARPGVPKVTVEQAPGADGGRTVTVKVTSPIPGLDPTGELTVGPSGWPGSAELAGGTASLRGYPPCNADSRMTITWSGESAKYFPPWEQALPVTGKIVSKVDARFFRAGLESQESPAKALAVGSKLSTKLVATVGWTSAPGCVAGIATGVVTFALARQGTVTSILGQGTAGPPGSTTATSWSGSGTLSEATLDTVFDDLPAGRYTLVAAYEGDANWTATPALAVGRPAPADADAATLIITAAPATLTLASATAQPVPDEKTQLVAQATFAQGDTPDGTVEFFDGTDSLGTAAVGADGTATLEAELPAVGSHVLTAKLTRTSATSPSATASTTVDVRHHSPTGLEAVAVGAHSFSLKWKLPDAARNNVGHIDVEYAEPGKPETVTDVPVVRDALSAKIGVTDPATSYNVEVSWGTRNGSSSYDSWPARLAVTTLPLATTSIAISGPSDPLYAGQKAQFTLTISSEGAPAHAPQVTWQALGLPADDEATTTSGTCGAGSCQLEDIPAGGSATITISGTVKGTDTADASAGRGPIRVSAEVSAENTEPGKAAVDRVVSTEPLVIVATVTPDTPTPQKGDTVTFALKARASGGSGSNTITAAVDATKGFAPAAAGWAVAKSGVAFLPGAGTTSLTGTAAVTGQDLSVSLRYRVKASGAQKIAVLVTVSDGSRGGGTKTVLAEGTVNAGPPADVSIGTPAITPEVEVGAQTTFSLTAAGSGGTARGTTVTLAPTSGVKLVGASSGDTACPGPGALGTITCTLGTLGDGANATVDVTVKGTQAGGASVKATVSSDNRDPDRTDNSVEIPVGVTQGVAVPENLRVTGQQSRSLDLAWDPVAGATAYRVEYRRAGDRGWTALASAGPTSKAGVTDLLPDTSYDMRVTAIGNGRAGLPSAPVTASTNKLAKLGLAVAAGNETTGATAIVGDTVTFTVTVSSTDAPAENPKVTIAGLAHLTGIATRTAAGSCTETPIVCSLDDIPAGGQTTITVTGKAADDGSSNIRASIAAGNGRDGKDVVAILDLEISLLPPNVGVAVTADKKSARKGDTVTITVTATDTGADAAGAAVTLTPSAGLDLTSTTFGDGKSCTAAGATAYSCSLGTLTPGKPVLITVKAKLTATGDQSLGASIEADNRDRTPGNNTAQVAVNATLPRANVSITAPLPKEGENVYCGLGPCYWTVPYYSAERLTFTVSSTGADARDVVVRFTPDEHTGDAMVDGLDCTDGEARSLRSCYMKVIPAGTHKDITVLVPSTTSGTFSVQASVTATNRDPDQGNNTAQVTFNAVQQNAASVISWRW